MSRIAGIASAFVNGAAAPAKGSCEYQEVTTKRTPQMGMDGTVVGFSEEGEASFISFTMYSTAGFSAGAMYAALDVQIVVQLANGRTVTGHSMTMMDPPTVKNEDGTFDCKWIGDVVESGA